MCNDRRVAIINNNTILNIIEKQLKVAGNNAINLNVCSIICYNYYNAFIFLTYVD